VTYVRVRLLMCVCVFAVLEPLVEHLREFNKVSGKLEVWLKEQESELLECGSIGANLDRCVQQETILAVRDVTRHVPVDEFGGCGLKMQLALEKQILLFGHLYS